MESVDARDGKLEKMEVDFSTTVDEKLPECEKLIKDGKLNEAIETLMSLEKQTRTAGDMRSTSRILIAIVKMCFEMNEWSLLNEHIVILTKRKGQLKQAVTKMVQECCTYIDQTPDKPTKMKLIDTLRTVTAGKIYVEIERARLTKILARIKEDEGDVAEAANILQELQVETFGSMEKREKVEFILEQMRLCLAKKDYIRTQIISKKINIKYFEDEKAQDLKLKYYQLMIERDAHDSSYLSICKHYRAVYDTKCIKEDDMKKREALRNVILYLILSPYDNEQSDLIHRVNEDKTLEEIPVFKDVLENFITTELMNWQQICQKYEAVLKNGSEDNPATGVFNQSNELGVKRWEDFKIRVVEHNIRVMAKYYTRINLSRMSELLALSHAETEEFLSNLVVNKTVSAKIDRLDGVIHFAKTKDPNDILNDWSTNITSLMNLVNKATHLITKEEMVHKLH